jgi:hypothetical protein
MGPMNYYVSKRRTELGENYRQIQAKL